MNQFKKTTIRLTCMYSLIFFLFIWTFSAGIYVWVDQSLGKGYVTRINEVIEQSTGSANQGAELSDDAGVIAADVALDRLRDIIVIVNIIALIAIPTIAYYLSRRSLKPLIESQLIQQQFIANASHELRTPLAVMAGELELASKRTRTITEYKKTIKETTKEVERMTKLVQELLLLARITSSTDNLVTREIDLVQLVREVTEPYIPLASKKNVHIHITSPKKVSTNARANLIGIAIKNLIDNAVKFSKNNSTIRVNIKDLNTGSAVTVSNEGKFLNIKQADYLFNRFYQANDDDSSGSGLGLAITKQIVELHHGKVTCTPRGTSAVFTIYLP